MRIDAPSAGRPARLPLLDALRGAALLAMIFYHFSWDLRFFGYIATDVATELGWRIFARSIASTFLALVGVGLVLSTRRGFHAGRFLRRLGIVAAAAAAVTIATYFAMPDAYIFFGILHAIAVSSVLALPFVWAPIPLVIAAAIFSLLAPTLFSGPVFDAPALLWLGLATYLPRTNDYVPIFPWFGVVLAGVLAARVAPRLWARMPPLKFNVPAPRLLVLGGRYSLVVYLTHQLILLSVVWLAAQIVPPSLLAFEPAYVEGCTASCVGAEAGADVCRRTCACLADRSQAEGLWRDLMRQTLSVEQERRYFALADACRAASEAP